MMKQKKRKSRTRRSFNAVRRLGKGRILLLIIAFAGLGYGVFPLQGGKTPESIPAVKAVLSPRTTLMDSVSLQLPFAVDSLCRISDPSHSLEVFLDELGLLLAGKDTVITIVHLGDSHVQAGFYSGQVMRMLQAAFGNAGRGWIAPLKLAKVNEPKDYRITSPAVKEWTIGRCTQKEPGCPWGLGGIGIQPRSKTVDFVISLTPEHVADYAFNELCLYRDEKALPLFPAGEDTAWVQTAREREPRVSDMVVDTFRLSCIADSLHLYGSALQDAPAAGCYYGFSLRNGQPGILYHSIGHNGAMFVNYTRPEYVRQLSLLKPSLLIITLGTNEAFSVVNFRTSDFVAQIDQFLSYVKEYLPSTAILLTTPAESYRHTRNGYVRNENISKAAAAIVAYAEEKEMACFDLYRATGGANSCTRWQEAKLLGRDRVHFTVEGYYEQGKLLYKGLIRLKMNQQNTTSR